MKERFLAGLKNASVIIIASLMLLGVIPLGMISHVTTVNAEGEFLRLFPEAELSLSAETMMQEDGVVPEKNETHVIGENQYGYLRFDLRELLGEKPEEISGATLRLSFLGGTTSKTAKVQLWLMPEDDWSKTMNWEKKPSQVGEISLATKEIAPETERQPALFEVSLKDYIKKWMEEGRKKVSFRIDGLGDGITSVYAGSKHQDPTFRPCLKVWTKKATDPDQKTLQKIKLSQKYATNQGKNTVATVGGGETVYLRFSLNPANIQGAIYRANLNLNRLRGDSAGLLRVDHLDNLTWKASELDAGKKPTGERNTIYREEDCVNETDGGSIDLTDVIHDAYAQGKKEISLVIWSENGKKTFDYEGKNEPWMEVLVSDDRNAVAMMETSLGILGENSDPEAITESLSDDRIAENGFRAAVSWTATDRKTGEPAEDVLMANGKIRRPEWFRDSREILARATITSGKYQRERICYLTVLPQEAPLLIEEELGTMLKFGNSESEKRGLFESAETEVSERLVGDRAMTCRDMGPDGMMILHLKTDPEKQNYFTVKLWEEDAFSGLVVSSLQDRTLSPIEILGTDMAEKERGGFLYLTYPLPIAYTNGRNYVSLRLTMTKKEIASWQDLSLEGDADWRESGPKVSLYGAYLTQTPYFDPMAFADQGEEVIKKTNHEWSFYQFLRKIYGAAERSLDFRHAKNPEATLPATQGSGVYTDTEDFQKSAVVFGKEEQLMIQFPQKGMTTRIYRDTPYYNAYSVMSVVAYHDGDLQAIEYGFYRIFRNRSDQEWEIPWEKESMAGLYQDLVDETYYSFLQDGQMVDDSVLPEEIQATEKNQFSILPGETVALMMVAEPLQSPAFRVSALNGQAVADVKLKDPLQISTLTIRAMGKVPEQQEELMVLYGVYDRGMLAEMQKQVLTVSKGQEIVEVLLEDSLLLQPGQTLRIFIEDQKMESKILTPVLELPQKQQTKEKKAS